MYLHKKEMDWLQPADGHGFPLTTVRFPLTIILAAIV